MRISDLITKLEKLKAHVGDNKIDFMVSDAFENGRTSSGTMDIDLRVGDVTGLPTDYNGFNAGDGWVNLKFHLNDNYDGHKPKIVYRKG
jgi:hypothetical protein